MNIVEASKSTGDSMEPQSRTEEVLAAGANSQEQSIGQKGRGSRPEKAEEGCKMAIPRVFWCIGDEARLLNIKEEWYNKRITVKEKALVCLVHTREDAKQQLDKMADAPLAFIIGHGVVNPSGGSRPAGVTLVDVSSVDAEYELWVGDFRGAGSEEALAEAIWKWFKYFLLKKKRGIPYFRHRTINPFAALALIVQSVEVALENGEEDEVRRICRDTRRDWIRGGGQVPEDLLVWAQDFLFGRRVSGKMDRWSLLDRLGENDPTVIVDLNPLAELLGGNIIKEQPVPSPSGGSQGDGSGETYVFKPLDTKNQWVLNYLKAMEALVRHPQPELWSQSMSAEGDWVSRVAHLGDYKGIRSIRQWLDAVGEEFKKLAAVKVEQS
jgi:hypothetical protein